MHITAPTTAPITGPTTGPTVYARIGAAIAAIGDAGCPAALAALLRSVAPYSYTVVFGFSGAARPLDLHDDFPPDKRRIFVSDYQAGPYLLDPFFLASTRIEGLHRMRDLAPDRFYQGEYFRNYYIRTGLAEEIGFFTPVGHGATVVLSLMRADKPFGAREFRSLQALLPVVQGIVTRHWADLSTRFHAPPPAPQEPASGAGIEQRFLGFGQGILTRREREVVEFTLKGHSADAVGRLLGISPGTVRIHRRNIYAKLRITSQGELFSRFIATLTGQTAAPPDGQ